MLASTARQGIVVAALVILGGCNGFSSSPGAPNSQAQTQSHVVSGSNLLSAVVHRGVPVGIRLPSFTLRSSQVAPSYSTGVPLLFEGDQSQSAVNVYKAGDLASNPAPIATIPDPGGCPYGMAMDKTGALYVAGNCGGNTVEEYPKGQTTPTVTITNGISNPLGLAIDKAGTLFASVYSPTAIQEYTYHTTSPSKTITGGGLVEPFGLALDSAGNLFIADFGASQVFELKAGGSSVTSLGLSGLTEPLGVAVDQKSGDLWVTDGSGDHVQVYHAGQTTPFQTITSGYTFPYAITMYNKATAVKKNPGLHSVAASNGGPYEVFAYKPNTYTSYATLTNNISLPTGLLWAKP
jgi:hypothetical protein